MNKETRSAALICLAALAVASIAAPAVSAAGAADSVQAIVGKYLEACGGQAIADIRTQICTGTLVRGASGAVPCEIRSRTPGLWRYDQTFVWGERFSAGFDGISAWMADSRGIDDLDPGLARDFRLIADPQTPLKLAEWYPQMRLACDTVLDDKRVVTILAKSPDGMSTELGFDADSGYLVLAGDLRFSDYRSVGSVVRPFKIVLGAAAREGHLPLTFVFTDIRIDADIDDSLLMRPTCALPMTDPPLHKPRKQVRVSLAAMDACVGTYRLADDTSLVFSVVRQGEHLMYGLLGRGQMIEIKPESETDYYIEFLNREYHFVKDETGAVVALEFGATRARRAERID